ncbi:MAG: MoaD/ThiS family protein [Candidatus Hydrogenedentes bacterium]|nr:MoaD/ThiS family protein [Candidatus Hydrogenedentota bacterium]
MKRLHVLYFAILREQRGLNEEHVQSAAATPAALYAELVSRHRFSLPQDRVRVVVNESFADWDSAISDGDSIVFIPPVAGG